MPLQMVALHVAPLPLVMALALLALLALLPQRIFLQHALRLVEQCADQGPPQGIETIGTHPTGGTRLLAPHGYRVFAGTAIIEIRIALADAQWPRRLHGQLTPPTPHEGPEAIPL